MLDNLMRYLEVALPCMRDESVDARAGAVALLEAYLNVQKIRMGRRLDFGIEIPPALATLRVPPMMLLTLVENALKHGLGPLPEGGAVRIEARRRARDTSSCGCPTTAADSAKPRRAQAPGSPTSAAGSRCCTRRRPRSR
jgi:LytS/YehU family sensor histidine kinase